MNLTICRDCPRRDDGRTRFWRWGSCEDCATSHADTHRRETGHQVELVITDTTNEGVRI